jgi:hypothetical protein
MSKGKTTVEVTLDGQSYHVQKFNIGQHRKALEILRGDPMDASFEILGLALTRAEPKVDDVDELGAGLTEVREAVSKILEFSGYKDNAVPNG